MDMITWNAIGFEASEFCHVTVQYYSSTVPYQNYITTWSAVLWAVPESGEIQREFKIQTCETLIEDSKKTSFNDDRKVSEVNLRIATLETSA